MLLKLFLALLMFRLIKSSDHESNAIVEHCETIPTAIHVTKEELDESGNVVRVCEGDVLVNKCEGNCASKLQPSVSHPTGFSKDCVCCRESWMDKKSVELTDCFDADGKRLKGNFGALIAVITEPKSCKCHKCGV